MSDAAARAAEPIMSVWGCVSNSVATTPNSAPRKIKEVLRITPTTDRDQWEHRPCGAGSVPDQEFIANQKTVPADLCCRNARLKLLSRVSPISSSYRLVQRLGSNFDAAVFAPGSTTTVVPTVTRL